MLKRGFFGPFRCCFCLQADETSDYIFVGCVYTQKAWAQFLSGLSISPPSNTEPVNLFSNWKLRYPIISSTSQEWRKIWQAIPKFFWWKIWLARNDLIFNNKAIKPERVEIKAKSLLLQAVGNIYIQPHKTKVEHKWLGLLKVDKI